MAVTAASTLHRFSTWDFPERERLPRWREEFARGLVRVEIEPLASDDRPFHAEATLQAFPGVRTGECMGSLARYDRTRALAAKGDGSIGVIVNLEGKPPCRSSAGMSHLVRAMRSRFSPMSPAS
jgi:hypothetical protein